MKNETLVDTLCKLTLILPFGFFTILFVNGMLPIFFTVCLFAGYGYLLYVTVITILCKIYVERRLGFLRYQFSCLETMHAERYHCYLSCQMASVEKYAKSIDDLGEQILNDVQELLEFQYFTKKQRCEIEGVGEKTKEYLSSIAPV